MKYRVEITSGVNKTYHDVSGADVIDIAVSLGRILKASDTYKKVPYREDLISEPRSGDKIILRTDTGSQEFKTLEEARQAAQKLAIDEGYDILSLEQPVGSKETKVIEQRPSLKEDNSI